MSGIPYFPNMSPYKAAGMLMKAAKAHAKGTHDKGGRSAKGARGGKSGGGKPITGGKK